MQLHRYLKIAKAILAMQATNTFATNVPGSGLTTPSNVSLIPNTSSALQPQPPQPGKIFFFFLIFFFFFF